jgi:glyoxylase-like metal-dependent hydrolase (beta-lactamase superfamily II)
VREPVIRLDLPLPWQLSQVNAYLAADSGGWTLFDCGIGTPEAVAAMEQQLGAAGISWYQIHTLILTHCHPDHLGMAPQVLERTGARLAMHVRERDHLHLLAAGNPDDEGFTLAGTPPSLADQVQQSFADLDRTFVPLEPQVLLADGDTISGATAIWTPGHSPGHLCFLFPDGSFLSGDHLLENITPNISWMPGEDCLGDFLESLRRVAALSVTRVLPGHGEPFTGHDLWARQTIAHHEERCQEILTALTIRPRTAHELVSVLWPRQLAPFHYRFAVYEVLAHLEYLRRQSIVLERSTVWSGT